MNMADMQKVEASVGEHDPFSAAAEIAPQRGELAQSLDLR
jgi:hypothetical protein